MPSVQKQLAGEHHDSDGVCYRVHTTTILQLADAAASVGVVLSQPRTHRERVPGPRNLVSHYHLLAEPARVVSMVVVRDFNGLQAAHVVAGHQKVVYLATFERVFPSNKWVPLRACYGLLASHETDSYISIGSGSLHIPYTIASGRERALGLLQCGL